MVLSQEADMHDHWRDFDVWALGTAGAIVVLLVTLFFYGNQLLPTVP